MPVVRELVLVFLFFILPTTLAQKQGEWSPIMRFPIIPVAAYIVPQYPESHRLVVFSAWSPNSFGGERGITQFAVYDHKTGLISRREVAETKHGR
jgi:galactose oxidase